MKAFSARHSLLLAAFVAMAGAIHPFRGAAAAESTCPDVLSTVEATLCLRKAVENTDSFLLDVMRSIAKQAGTADATDYTALWEQTLTGFYDTTTDPIRQFEMFRATRTKACAYMNSLAFRSTGLGIAMAKCELRLSEGLLRSLRGGSNGEQNH